MAEPIHATIDEQIKGDDVVLYMKGTPVFPMCGFSAGVVQVLSQLDVKYQAYNVLDDMELREGIKTYSNWPTIPQLYVKGEFIGGFDIVREMAESGELQSMLEEKGLADA
jgi:monothiol glutaredoxin